MPIYIPAEVNQPFGLGYVIMALGARGFLAEETILGERTKIG